LPALRKAFQAATHDWPASPAASTTDVQ
jgi:hypothetical protein